MNVRKNRKQEYRNENIKKRRNKKKGMINKRMRKQKSERIWMRRRIREGGKNNPHKNKAKTSQKEELRQLI